MGTVCHNFDFVFVYLDEILVGSKDDAEHRTNLKELFYVWNDTDLSSTIVRPSHQPKQCHATSRQGRSHLKFSQAL